MKQYKSLNFSCLFLFSTFFSHAQTVGIGSSSFTPGSMLSIKGNLSVGSGYETTAAPTDGMIVKGNTGIGTTTANTKLEVSGSENNSTVGAGASAVLKIVNTNISAVGKLTELHLGCASTTKYAAISGYLSDASNNTRGDILFSTRNAPTDANLTERVRIDGSGNVGIGTSSPAEKLHVSGNIRTSSLTGTGTQVIAADANGVLTRTSISDDIAPLVAADMAHHFTPGSNNANHTGFMAAFVPSTGKIWCISTNYTTNVENFDITSGGSTEWNNVSSVMTWVDFGDPNGASTAYVIALDVAVSSYENNDETAAMMVARMSDGAIYIRSTTSASVSAASLDNTSNWGSWTLATDPGE